MASRRMTMRDIAQKLGIDPSTVSLAMRNSPLISEAVKLKVRQTAEQIGYQPDPMLAALAHYRHRSEEAPVRAELAWINRWIPPNRLKQYQEFERLWQGARDIARANGYHLEEFIIQDKPLRELEKTFRARNIKGILIPSHPHQKEWDMDWSRYSVVRFGYSTPNLPTHAVVADQFGAGMLAFQKIHEKGYRRIGFVSTFRAELVSFFSGGFLLSEARLPSRHRIPFLLLDQNSEKDDRKKLALWLKRHRPDALLTTMEEMPGYLASLGYGVPDDIGLATTSVLDGKVDSGIDQNSYELGKLAVELLVSLINHHHRGFPHIRRTSTTTVQWVDGHSLPLAKAAWP